MNRVLITSVGTSALGNWRNSWIRAHPWFNKDSAKLFFNEDFLKVAVRWPDSLPLPDKLKWQAFVERGAEDYINQAEPVFFSAETNSLWNMNPPVTKRDEIVLITSDTNDGQLSGRLVETYLRQRLSAEDVEVRYVPDLSNVTLRTTSAEERFLRGLSGFANLVKAIIYEAKEQGKHPFIIGTGGFKAEIAVVTVIGAVMGIPVYYLHETLKQLVEMPTSKMELPTDLVNRNWEFFYRAADSSLHQVEKDAWCSAEKDLNEYVQRVSEESDLWTLNTAGLNLWIYSFAEPSHVAPASLSRMRSDLGPLEKVHLRSPDIEPHRPREVDTTAAKIAEIEWTHGIFYRKERPGVPNRVTRVGSDFHVYVRGFMLAVTTPRPVDVSDTEKALEALKSCL